MKRLLIWVTLLVSLWQSPVQAQTDFTTPIVTQLESEGYTVSKIKRTWLGRILIVANTKGSLREIVLNRQTGMVLHDQTIAIPKATTQRGTTTVDADARNGPRPNENHPAPAGSRPDTPATGGPGGPDAGGASNDN